MGSQGHGRERRLLSERDRKRRSRLARSQIDARHCRPVIAGSEASTTRESASEALWQQGLGSKLCRRNDQILAFVVDDKGPGRQQSLIGEICAMSTLSVKIGAFAIAILSLAAFLSSFGLAAKAGLSSLAGAPLSVTESTGDKHLAKSKSSPQPPSTKYEAPKAPRTTQEGRSQERSQEPSGTRSSSASSGGRSCRSCRSGCYQRWRSNCGYTSTCKKRYASCMRNCAQEHC